ncbi:MAG TPA: hypothetical protein VGM56_00705 [Byssovorax sp.]|jgi:hypothetical protein
MQDLVQLACLAMLTLPIGLVALAIKLESRAKEVAGRALAAFAAGRGLRDDGGGNLTGTIAGVAIAVERIASSKGVRSHTRVRAVEYDARRPHAVASVRGVGTPGASLEGLVDRPTGDAAFDGMFASYTAPGDAPPWSSGARAGMAWLASADAGAVEIATCAPAECAVFVWSGHQPALLGRAVSLAAALTSPERDHALGAELAAPLVVPVEPKSEAATAVAWMMGGSLLGLFMAPISLAPPFRSLLEIAACGPGHTLRMVGQMRGGAAPACYAGEVFLDHATGWMFGVGAAVGTVIGALIGAAIFAMIRRSRAR